ncbi:MAG: O-antigen ligase family protein [Gammaproteobacteria bacterium]
MPARNTPRFLPMALPLVWLLLASSAVVFIEPAPYDVLLVALLIGLFAAGLRIPREIRFAILLLGAFAASNILAAALSAEPLESLRSVGIRTYMVLAWLFYVCIVSTDPDKILPLIWQGYLVAAVGTAVFGILEYYGYVHNPLWPAGVRAKGAFKDPNVYGPFLVPAALYCVSQLSTSAVLRSLVHLVMFLLVVFAVLLSFSRGAWMNLGLSLGLLLVFILATARPSREKVGAVLAAGVVALAAAAIVVTAVTFTAAGSRFKERAVLTQSYDVAQGGRFYTQLLALQRVGRTPLGVGPGRADEEFGLEPHNLYLHVLVEGGWVAGLAFYAVIALTFWRGSRLFRWRSPLREPFLVVLAALTGILFQSFFIDSTHWRHLWLMLGLSWALIVVAERPAPGDIRQ